VDPSGAQATTEYSLLQKIRTAATTAAEQQIGITVCQELVKCALLGLGGGPNALGQAGEMAVGDAFGPQALPQVGLGNRRPDFRLGFWDYLESKNAAGLSLTAQLRQTAAVVTSRGGDYYIITRASTALRGLSGPLRAFVNSTPGVFIIGCLPG
jgi:hypothetical protein